jgi:tRNA threonylcarbamoyl adenosine modification protein YeaZ
MISLAFDSASDRCTVAASDGARTAHRQLDGARGHATAILGLLDEVLLDLGVGVSDVGRVLTGDGPGSFTGLRVATAVAKAITWGRQVEWRTAPSLLLRASAHALQGGVVLALSDALRGDVYAGCWRFGPVGVQAVHGMPRAMRPEALAAFGPLDKVVGTVTPAMAAAVAEVTGHPVIGGDAALPDARELFRLAALTGGTTLVADAAAWEPEYGRPAEAQAVWERTHGRELPNPPGIVR